MGYARVHRSLGATTITTGAPVSGRPQSPIRPLVVSSAYLAVRSSPADGSCGVSGYPCQHPGVDVLGSLGTPVVAPESGTVVAAGSGSSPPYVGYGPWFVIIQGASGKFHMLAHLDPSTAGMAPQGARVVAGDQVGVTSSANHTHWEVRRQMTPPPGGSNFTNNEDPITWLATASLGVGAALIVGGAAVFLWMLYKRRRA